MSEPSPRVSSPRRIGRSLVLWVPVLGALVLAAGVLMRRGPSTTGEHGADAPASASGPDGASDGHDEPAIASPSAGGASRRMPAHPTTAVGPTASSPGGVRIVDTTRAPTTGSTSPAAETGALAAPPAPPPSPPPGPVGSMDPEVVRDTVREAMPFLRFCFEWQLDRHPELGGRVSMEWRILSDGTVVDANVADDQLHDDTVLRCFRGVIGRLEFPPPDGGEVTVRYPFVLAGSPPPERPEGI